MTDCQVCDKPMKEGTKIIFHFNKKVVLEIHLMCLVGAINWTIKKMKAEKKNTGTRAAQLTVATGTPGMIK